MDSSTISSQARIIPTLPGCRSERPDRGESAIKSVGQVWSSGFSRCCFQAHSHLVGSSRNSIRGTARRLTTHEICPLLLPAPFEKHRLAVMRRSAVNEDGTRLPGARDFHVPVRAFTLI